MDIKKALVDTTIEVLLVYGLLPVFKGEYYCESIISAEYINVVMGVSGALKGNMVVTVNKGTALGIVSSMFGGNSWSEDDDMLKSAIGELLNIIAGNALIKVDAASAVHISPPTFVTGENICIFISRLKSSKLAFEMDDYQFDIAYSIE
ncbi:MAG: chemotaxis protein CheX [Clostridiaceae bacterium]|nr:chemotaxis protein CheX [Clostridiaceae bacterium]